MVRSLVVFLLALAATPALAGSGSLTIGSVSGSSPGPYTVTMTSSVSGVTVGDDFGCRLSGGQGAIYSVSAVNTSLSQLTLVDDRTSHQGAVFGAPPTGAVGWYATPAKTGAAADVRVAKPPYTALGWDAPYNLNYQLLSERVASIGRAGYGGSAPLSSSTSTYASVATYSLTAYTFDVNGAAVRVTANLRQNTGSGVGGKLLVSGNATTAATIVGLVEWILVREGTNLVVYTRNVGATCAYQRDSISGLNFTAALDVSPQIVGSSTALSTAMDFTLVERLR